MQYELRYASSGILVSAHRTEQEALTEVRWMAWACGRSLVERLQMRCIDPLGGVSNVQRGADLIERSLGAMTPAIAPTTGLRAA